MGTEELQREHLASLHARAAKLGIEGYRKLPRERLIEEIAAAGGGEAPGGSDEPAPEAEAERESRPRRRGGRRPGGRTREAEEREEEEREPGGEPTTGVLDVVAGGHGFLRLKGLEPGPEDVYVSASQIRRCELRSGDQVDGPARPPRRGERHPALVRVERVNGGEPGSDRPQSFDELTPVRPSRRIPLKPDPDAIMARAADLIAPLAYGQRVLVVSEPHSGRTTLLRQLTRAIAGADDAPGVIVMLVDERPEEVTEWRRQVEGVEIAAAAADLDAEDQVRHAELALARAKRRAESGEDVVVIIDSLTRLGVAYRDPIAIKPVFGAGREIEEEGKGSLTIVATVLKGSDDGEGAVEAVDTTESSTIVLDAELARAGVVPAIDFRASGAVGEEQLREPEELDAARRLHEELRSADAPVAAERLAERIRSSASNAELLSSL
jgi:transcription termination factor Rho